MAWLETFIIAILIITLVISLWGLYNKNTNGIYKSKRRLDGKTAIVTGGTSGIGLETAVDLAGRGARVIVACPFQKEGEDAEKIIKKKTENDKVIFKLLDLASFASVRGFADDILKSEERLDILVNNAGIGAAPPTFTKDGLIFFLQVNYFGHFLLTLLLLPLLKKSGSPNDKSRIVNVTSILQNLAIFDTKNLNKAGYVFWFINNDYATSKAYLMLFTKELSERLKSENVIVNSVEPGAVGSRIFSPFGTWGSILTYMYTYLAKNVWEGAQTLIFAAVDEKASESGKHFKDCQEVPRYMFRNIPFFSARFSDKVAKKVWNESVKLVQLSEEEINLLM